MSLIHALSKTTKRCQHNSSTGGRFGKEPIRGQHFKFQPIREPYLAHVTGLAGRVFLRSGTESNALRAGLGRLGPSAVGHGSEAGDRK